MIIVDTTIAVKWVVDEVGRQAALTLLERSDELIAPDFMLAEAAHVLRRKVRVNEITSAQMREGISFIKDAIVTFLPTTSLVEDAAIPSEELDHSPYDCCFLASALGRGVLITADEAFAEKCGLKGYSRVVARLADLGTGRLDAALSVSMVAGDVIEPVMRLAPLIQKTFRAVTREIERSETGIVLSSLKDRASPFKTPTFRSFESALTKLNSDQLAVLLALGWLGRDYYRASDWARLLENARRGALTEGPLLHSAYLSAQMNAVPEGLAKLRAYFDLPE